MIWSYLAQFWNSVTSVVVTGGEYTVAWFQSLGNAVAGAIGSVFDSIFHLGSDFFMLIGYFINIVFLFVKSLIVPIDYFFNYLWSGVTAIFQPMTHVSDLPVNISSSVIDVFDALPFWSYFGWALGAIIMFFVGFKVFRLIIKI